jgi:hypothetical protein
MSNAFESLFNALTPELALAGGIPFPPQNKDEKPTLGFAKGGKGGGGSPPPPPAPPAPPVINIPPAPVAPPPPPPPTASSADVALAGQEALAKNKRGFGYSASLLRGGSDTKNSATGEGSLLGNS